MAEIHSLPSRINQEGGARLAAALEEVLASGRDVGSRRPQIKALGGSIQRACEELRRAVEELHCERGSATGQGAEHDDLLRFREQVLTLADAFARLGAVVRTYPI